MQEQRIRITATREPWERTISLRFGVLVDGNWNIAQPLAMERAPSTGAYVMPFLTLQPEVAQALMDELWQCGLRPTEGTGSAGSLAATERHLADMRRIAMEGLMERGLILAPHEMPPRPSAGLSD